ncbi:succinate dehydrogenase / fumarate reductase membrane anchor subunit [Sphingomonas sp. BE270]|jgi:succinate dehydrogenase / fumarate reductase membrane anchor subunit|uniref:succinate dehydrogenase, hydrophobic membrane anchor protein n=1 Tax=unclassified Sphingomonas TaxID=196159 RepID=UPI00053E23A5|nr:MULTISPECIES: succinate dehydrogenase, hydrophobic membrane anchor protein [unclassified Sphingomonas]MDR6848666.1 succinate dehydrogenase / fumarate reductase membrane anchor subunit [Sphingomonas sp. BE137]MDR7255948.1 succinate dehydrogenase / fumarate reductase membrane anchor subunit [Sphingomonas sp. BE270]RUN76213.1 succinate dehydrogenase, hydrophobic membrane anchor protein [Sphingomonas sp. TF3]
MGNGTELGRVRGLGSAKEGAHHWWAQRVTAAANLFLMVWFFVAIARMPAYDYDTARGWLQSPWAAIPMGLLIVSVFYHFRLGLQVLIEDYVHGAARVAWLLILNFFTFGTAAIALFAILKVAFTATTGAPHA